MGGLKNGNPKHTLTVDEARKGGKKSGETRAKQKTMREAFELLCSKEYTDAHGNKIDGVTLLCMKQFQAAMSGDTKAFIEIRNTLGQKPVERIETVEIPPETYARVEAILSED